MPRQDAPTPDPTDDDRESEADRPAAVHADIAPTSGPAAAAPRPPRAGVRAIALRSARAELRDRPGAQIALAVLLILSATLAATGALTMERLVGGVDRLFEQALPPHVLQMHQGEIDAAALDRFAAEHPEIDSWLLEETLGFDGAAISWEQASTGARGDLADDLVDQLFVAQNDAFDFLVDETGAAPHPAAGEVYVPVAAQQRLGLEPGDAVRIATESGVHELRVAGAVRDAQMGSSLASATRWLVSQGDLDALAAAGGGAPETIVEYRLQDPAASAALLRAYEADPALPKNGQAVTGDMIRLVNAFGDGIVAIALGFASVLLVAIAALDLRFVIRGRLDERVRELGAMKAIGLPERTIARLQITPFVLLALVACVVGGLLSIGATALLVGAATVSTPTAPIGPLTFVAPVAALLAVFAAVAGMCALLLRRVRRVPVVNALVHGSLLDERAERRRDRRAARRARRSALVPGRGLPVGARLALREVMAERGQWILVPAVFALAAVLVVLPAALVGTFENPRFVSYLGAPDSALRIDLRFSDGLEAQEAAVADELRADARITDVRVFTERLAEVDGPEGPETMRIESGDYRDHGIEYVRGAAPADGEIALSASNASALGLAPGDRLAIRLPGATDAAGAAAGGTDVVVSGVYQDVTSGGRTAKLQDAAAAGAAFTGADGAPAAPVGYVLYADTEAGVDATAVAAEYREAFPDAGVVPMREYVTQTLAYVTSALRVAAIVSAAFGLGVAALITSLFVGLRLTRDRRTRGLLGAIGFARRDLDRRLVGTTLVGVVAGTAIGTVLAVTAGAELVSLGFAASGFGIERLALLPDPLVAFVLCPLALVAAGLLAAVAVTAVRSRRTTISDLLRS